VFQCYLDVSDAARRVIKVKLKGMHLNELHSQVSSVTILIKGIPPQHLVTPKFMLKKITKSSGNLMEDGAQKGEVQQPLTSATMLEKVVNATVGPEHHLHHFYFQRVKSAKLSRRKEEEDASVRE